MSDQPPSEDVVAALNQIADDLERTLRKAPPIVLPSSAAHYRNRLRVLAQAVLDLSAEVERLREVVLCPECGYLGTFEQRSQFDKRAEKAEAQRDALLAGMKELLLGGAHAGPCDNDGGWEACDIHCSTADERSDKARALIAQVEKEEG